MGTLATADQRLPAVEDMRDGRWPSRMFLADSDHMVEATTQEGAGAPHRLPHNVIQYSNALVFPT